MALLVSNYFSFIQFAVDVLILRGWPSLYEKIKIFIGRNEILFLQLIAFLVLRCLLLEASFSLCSAHYITLMVYYDLYNFCGIKLEKWLSLWFIKRLLIVSHH